ncbi:lamin tail domain-containing protein [Polaribacter sp. M15]
MKKNYFFTLILTLIMTTFSFSQVIITELADPNDAANARYVELYNIGNTAADLTGWSLKRWTNGNSDSSSNIDLSAITNLAPGSFVLIAANETGFKEAYNDRAPDIVAGSGGPADSNGDDQIALFNSSDVMVDIFGVPGEDGSGTCHEFEDGRAERKATATTPKTTWDEADWNVWADSSVSDCSSHTNETRNVADNDFDPGAWIGTASAPTISVSSTVSNLDYFEGNGPSTEKTFTVEGLNLTENISVNAPTDFEISTTSGSDFGASLTLPESGGIVNSTTIYVRLKSGLAVNSYTGDITVASGDTNKTLTVSGTVSPADPQINITSFIDPMTYIESQGGPSTEEDFSVSGLFLTSDITITAPTNFEVSLTSGQDFSSSVTITPSSGTVASTEVILRLASGLSVGDYSGQITISSTGVADQTIDVTGQVFGPPTRKMIITGVYDGSLTNGTPKGVELFVLQDISDLSLFGVSSAANGGGSTAGNVEFSLPSGSATAGTFIYIATEETNFNTFFGMNPTHTSSSMAINGDDAIELYESGQIIDVFGDVNNDFSGEAYDYLDGWAYRKSNSQPGGTTFTETEWTYSGVDGLEGGTNNATATTPFPIGSFTGTLGTLQNSIEGFATYPNPVTNNQFTITSNSLDTKKVAIFNVIGKKVFTTSVAGTKSIIDVSSISSGLYILKVTEGNKIATSKLVIE